MQMVSARVILPRCDNSGSFAVYNSMAWLIARDLEVVPLPAVSVFIFFEIHFLLVYYLALNLV